MEKHLFFLAIIFTTRFIITNRLTMISNHFVNAARQEDYSNINYIEIKGRDEIFDLASSFNTLSDKLKSFYSSLDRQVKERTRELADKNEQLQLEIKERKRAEEQIKASLEEKEMLLQEIHHRAKNNMQIISSLLKLQASSSKDKKVENALKESKGRVQAMSLVHETLWDSASMASIDFKSYISKLAKTVFQSYGISREQVELKIEAENISFRIDQFSHIGLLINELVSNSLKYAFPENRKGEIVIRLGKIDQDEIELTVGDNGLGIPESIDWRNTNTLGLQLVTTLAEDQLDGTLNLDRVNGTHFNIRFKLKES